MDFISFNLYTLVTESICALVICPWMNPDDYLSQDDLCLIGKKVLLIPYEREFVPLYHSWMQDKTLLQQTATEPLSLEEEYENQLSWRLDPHKYTFLIVYLVHPSQPQCIVGDVNLFLLARNDDTDEECEEEKDMQAEVEVMIASRRHRRLGLATEAVQLMMAFARQYLGLNTFIAKIGSDNVASIGLFQRLGFQIFRRVDVFSEVHMRKTWTTPPMSFLQVASWKRDWSIPCQSLLDDIPTKN